MTTKAKAQFELTLATVASDSKKKNKKKPCMSTARGQQRKNTELILEVNDYLTSNIKQKAEAFNAGFNSN